VRIWRTSDGEVERTVSVPEAYAYLDVALTSAGNYWFRPDGAAVLLSLGKGTGQAQLFDLARGELVGRPTGPDFWAGINKVAFSPDGSRIAVVGGNQSGQICDLTTGQRVTPPFKHGGSLLDIDWSPDGRRVLTAGLAHDVRIWEAATGELSLSPLPTGKHHNRAGRWSADGRFIVTRSDDRLARVWDASSAEAVTPVFQHSGEIRWACITPDNRLITASEPNLLRAWDLIPTALAPDALVDYAKLLSGRRLNASGALIPLKSDELERLYRSLRARTPQLFE
jgi:WD40 repeat protein